MKTKFLPVWAAGLLLASSLLSSCQKELEPTTPAQPLSTTPDAADLQIRTVDEGNYHGEIVPLELAKQVAENETFQQLYLSGNKGQAANNARLGNLKRTIRQAVSFKDKHNQPAVHVVTYNQGGFAILSAEKNAPAVLAMGDEDSVDVKYMPEVVKNWLGQEQASVEQQRTSRRGARVGARAEVSATSSGPDWTSLLASTGLSQSAKGARTMALPLPPPPDGPTPEPEPPCQQTKVTYFEPLVKSKWSQTGGHVDYVYPFNAWVPNGAQTGCWPVAAGMIMKYYRYPTSFVSHIPSYHYGTTLPMNWSKTYHNYAGGETAMLLANFGYAGKTVWGNTWHASSGMYNVDAVAALKNVFGYKTVKFHGETGESSIINEINGQRPVILIGYDPGYTIGHAIVCSGYRKVESTCSLNTYWLHMNWGWGGDWNGYYYGRSFYSDNNVKGYNNSDDEYYSSHMQMVSIRPEASW